MADWYYIGHYGQLGPLTFEQMEELVQGGVIARDTYVWRNGMGDWVTADRSAELQDAFSLTVPIISPPPPPVPRSVLTPPQPKLSPDYLLNASPHYYPTAYGVIRSDRSRALGGLLQVFPGVGRMYLGYWAHGVLQLLLTLFCGVGLLWSWIDGLIILAGGVKLDGYGRRLPE